LIIEVGIGEELLPEGLDGGVLLLGDGNGDRFVPDAIFGIDFEAIVILGGLGDGLGGSRGEGHALDPGALVNLLGGAIGTATDADHPTVGLVEVKARDGVGQLQLHETTALLLEDLLINGFGLTRFDQDKAHGDGRRAVGLDMPGKGGMAGLSMGQRVIGDEESELTVWLTTDTNVATGSTRFCAAGHGPLRWDVAALFSYSRFGVSNRGSDGAGAKNNAQTKNAEEDRTIKLHGHGWRTDWVWMCGEDTMT
jgi:hypothetical protein